MAIITVLEKNTFDLKLPGTLREVLDNETITRDNISLTRLGMTKGKSGVTSMMLKTGV